MNSFKRFVNGKFVMRLPWVGEYIGLIRAHRRMVGFGAFLKFKSGLTPRCRYWPVHASSEVTRCRNIFVGINSMAGIRPGCYIQGNGKVFIGDYVSLPNNCCIISGNHDFYDHLTSNDKEVIIGDYTWIGVNSVVLPGVVLGPRTVVAAGSVVTKSFPSGFCVIGGVPARLIKVLDKDRFRPFRYEEEYYGYVPKSKFEKYRNKYLQPIKFDFNMQEVTQNPFYHPAGGNEIKK